MSDVPDTQLRQFQAWFKADREHSAKWRKEAEMFKGGTNEEFTGTRSPRLLNEAMG